MNKINSAAGDPLRHSKLAGFDLKTLAPLASVTILLTACGGGGPGWQNGGGSGGQGGPTPILQIGMQLQYTGTTTRSITYTNPSGTQQNNTLVDTFTKSINVLQAPLNTGAAFDVQSVYNYTVTQDPATGTVPISETVDSYENLWINGGVQATATVGESVTTVQNDESANASGNGPYTATTTSQYNYPTPIPGPAFPLQTGATFSVPLAEVVNTHFADVNGNGSAPSNGSSVAYNSQLTQNSDGSFNRQINRVNGVTLNTTVNSNGSGSYSSSGGTTGYLVTIGVPVLANGAYTIPVNYSITTPTASSTNYSATDWYPGNGLPPSPLANEMKTIVGPATTLPDACNGALAQPDMFEVDTSETSLSVTGSYLVSTTRAFNANGVVVCSLLQQTNTEYDVVTGMPTEATTTQTTTLLTGLNSPM